MFGKISHNDTGFHHRTVQAQNTIIDNAKLLFLAIKTTLWQINLQPDYKQNVNARYKQVWDKLEQIQLRFSAFGEKIGPTPCLFYFTTEYEAIISSLNDILPVLKEIPHPTFEPENLFLIPQEPPDSNPIAKICSLIEQAKSWLSHLFAAGYRRSCPKIDQDLLTHWHNNEIDPQCFGSIYNYFKQILEELKYRITTATTYNYHGTSITTPAEIMAIEGINQYGYKLEPKIEAFSIDITYEPLFQTITDRLEKINPATLKQINQEQLTYCTKQLKELIKLLANKSSDLQNLEHARLKDDSSNYQIYEALTNLAQGSNIFRHEPSKKMHANQNHLSLGEAKQEIEATDPNLQVSNPIITEADNATNLASTTDNLVNYGHADSKLLNQAVREFFTQLGSNDFTSNEFVKFLTDYIPYQENDEDYALSDSSIYPKLFSAKVKLDLQMAITAYHIFLSIYQSKQKLQLPLQYTIFDFYYLKKPNCHLSEYKTLINAVLGKHSLKIKKDFHNTFINKFLIQESGNILLAAQNYLFENKLIDGIRPLYVPIPNSSHSDTITQAVTNSCKSSPEFTDSFKNINDTLTKILGSNAPFISFKQLMQYVPNLQVLKTKESQETHNELSPLHLQLVEFFKGEPELSENYLITKLSNLISEQANHITALSKPQKICDISKLPENFRSESKFIISVYFIYIILYEWQVKNNGIHNGIQFIKDNICNFSYFMPNNKYNTNLSKLLSKLYNKYSNNYSIKKFTISQILKSYFDDIVFAVQHYFNTCNLIKVIRPLYNVKEHKHLDIPALLDDIIFEIEELKSKSPKLEAGEFNIYKKIKYANRRIAEKLGENAPLINICKFKNSDNSKNQAVANTRNTSLTKRKPEDPNWNDFSLN